MDLMKLSGVFPDRTRARRDRCSSGVAQSRPRRVARRVAPWLLASAVLVSSGCVYGFAAAGGGLPKNLRTVAVLPFENMTPVAEIQREVFEGVRRAMNARLNLRDAAEASADVLVKGVIQRYEIDLPVGVAADPRQATSARRKLQLVVDLEIIDQTTGEVLVDRKGLSRESQYAEGAELKGRKDAVEQMINELIDGMQSQGW